MNIALLGYGKMGKAIEEIALQKEHSIVLRIHDQNLEELNVFHVFPDVHGLPGYDLAP